MRKLSFCFVFVFCVQLSLAQQPGDTTWNVDGRTGLTFSISGLYLGGGIGGKYWLNNYRSVRFEVAGSYDTDKTDRPLVDSSIYNYDRSQTSFSLTVYLATRFERALPLAPYAGVSLGLRWDRESSEYNSLTGKRSSDYTRRVYTGGVFLGVEYWLSEDVSLAGEQSLRLSYSKNSDVTSFNTRNSTSSLLLTIYF